MKICQSVKEINVSRDMWQVLRESTKPIVMYGMGNGADKILAVFSQKGIEVSDFFASDGFVRHQIFHGKTVMSYAEICEKYDDFIVVVSFGSRLLEVLANIYKLDGERELYVPDVPVVNDGELFDLDFFERHRDELDAACELFCDDLSRQTFCDVILYRLTGKIGYLRRHTVTPDEVMSDILSAKEYRFTADLGAYNGDSIRELREYAPRLTRVVAFEPDARTYKKLTAFAHTVPYDVEAHNCAAWDSDTILEFTAGGNRNSTLIGSDGVKTGAKIKTVEAARLDSVYNGACDYIKYDVEGAEYEAILGSRETIEKEHPQLLVSLYHRSEDIYRLPMLVKSFGYNRLFLRRYEYLPAWDLNLLAAK
ncbi:MAG: FkbM family methyltransferase [Clostridia bacterium]|nr:FkbM family methyltransferase [Clostridia bacterium]